MTYHISMTSPTPYARVIADSVSHEGYRLITVEAGGWRPILAEQNTHRVLSRNSASSRAIPIEKNLLRFEQEFMYPAEWGAERPGMQPGAALEGEALSKAIDLWDSLAHGVWAMIRNYTLMNPLFDEDGNAIEGATRLHKSLLNRWLEIGLQQVQIITGTQWDGYFWQRCHEHADKNIRLMAEAIQTAISESEPTELLDGWWHLPYFGKNGGFDNDSIAVDEHLGYNIHRQMHGWSAEKWDLSKKISAGRCARVSHMNQSGVRDIQDDLTLYSRLADRSDEPTNPPHASPLEHVARPWAANVQTVELPNGKMMGPLPKLGNFVGYLQFRHEELAF